MNNICLFECDVIKYGTSEKVGTIHVLAYNLFQATHNLIEYINDENSGFTGLVEMGSVRKLTDITKIINPYFAIEMDMEEDSEEYDPEMPYKVVENIPDDSEMVMKFKCSCHEEIRVSSGGWLYIQCKNCENRIYRREIQDVGGINIYVPMNK